MSRPYLITFTPLGSYFFGSYLSFKEGFHVVSNRFPQQTGILGCLRSTLLKQNKLLNGFNYPDFENDMDKIHALTGTSKMNGIDEDDDNFGIINRISPVFLVIKNGKEAADFLFQAPWDAQLIDGQIRYVEYKSRTGVKTFVRNQDKSTAVISDRDHKKGNSDIFGGLDFWQAYLLHSNVPNDSYLKAEDIFKKRKSKGIARKERQTVNEAFYVKTDYRFTGDYAFGVIVHFAEYCVLEKQDISFGGESSLFRLEVHEADEIPGIKNHPLVSRFLRADDSGDFFGEKKSYDEKKKVVLISNFVAAGFIDGIEHAMIPDLYPLSTRIFPGGASGSFRALPAGSILFPGNSISLNGSLYKIPNKIGLNWAIQAARGF
ncbi:MAG: hypothetical protein MUO31_11820 [Thermodesulfovibrionales bacterium]|nr:hypothetical protein [Thermodesulfovibrionales bacterium]